jgi:hypothetical protein
VCGRISGSPLAPAIAVAGRRSRLWPGLLVGPVGLFWDKMLVDAMTMRMVLRPQTLDTIVVTNLHAGAIPPIGPEFLSLR